MEQLAIFQPQESAASKRPSGSSRPTARKASESQAHLPGEPPGMEALLTSREAARVLKIHPKVLERMAKRGEVPALKVGKFWRYRGTALDEWINSRLQSSRQPCRMKTSF
jgi:excisionase family DNA binding protein